MRAISLSIMKKSTSKKDICDFTIVILIFVFAIFFINYTLFYKYFCLINLFILLNKLAPIFIYIFLFPLIYFSYLI